MWWRWGGGDKGGDRGCRGGGVLLLNVDRQEHANLIKRLLLCIPFISFISSGPVHWRIEGGGAWPPSPLKLVKVQ